MWWHPPSCSGITGENANQQTLYCLLVSGTLRLREAMSKQLVKMAATARPTLMAAAQEQLVALRAELASLPPAAVLGDGHAELLRLIDDVSINIHVSDRWPAIYRNLHLSRTCTALLPTSQPQRIPPQHA
jgi:hypothetical protein